MTLKDLSQLYWLRKEIREYEHQLQEMMAALDPSGPRLTGMPTARNGVSTVEIAAIRITEIEAALDGLRARCHEERMKLEQYIAEIPDSMTRLIFRYRFIDGNTWARVARRMGGNNTAESVRQTCCRYVHSTQRQKKPEA